MITHNSNNDQKQVYDIREVTLKISKIAFFRKSRNNGNEKEINPEKTESRGSLRIALNNITLLKSRERSLVLSSANHSYLQYACVQIKMLTTSLESKNWWQAVEPKVAFAGAQQEPRGEFMISSFVHPLLTFFLLYPSRPVLRVSVRGRGAEHVQ